MAEEGLAQPHLARFVSLVTGVQPPPYLRTCMVVAGLLLPRFGSPTTAFNCGAQRQQRQRASISDDVSELSQASGVQLTGCCGKATSHRDDRRPW